MNTPAPKHTTPTQPVLPGGHRMGSMAEPMAAQPVIEKDTPVPSTTPTELQQGGELQGKSVPTPEPVLEPNTPIGLRPAFPLQTVGETKVDTTPVSKSETEPPQPEAAKAGKTKTDGVTDASGENKPTAGDKSVGSRAHSKARGAAGAGVSSPNKRGGSTRK